MTKKQTIIGLVFAILEENPDGLRFAELTRQIAARSPELNPETIKYYLHGLPDSHPELVYRPARGVFRLTSQAGRPVKPSASPPRSTSAAVGEPASDGRNGRTFVNDREGRPVAVLLPMEEYERLLAASGETSPAERSSWRRPPGLSDAEALAAYVRSLDDFAFVQPAPPRGHMGGTLADCVLQRGMNYDAVVLPRVRALISEHPEAATTSGFAQLMDRVDLDIIVDFKGEYALSTIRELVRLLLEVGVETEEELCAWLEEAANRARLAQVSGIGPKTGEFIRLRCGAPDAVAVDRWIVRMLREAGVAASGFWEQHRVVLEAAALLGVSPAEFEESAWTFFRSRP